MKYPIPATFYKLPNGEKHEVFLEAREEPFFKKAMIIIKSGFKFEFEVLTTDEVSLTIVDLKKDQDVAIEIASVNHNLAVTIAFQTLIIQFNPEKPNA